VRPIFADVHLAAPKLEAEVRAPAHPCSLARPVVRSSTSIRGELATGAVVRLRKGSTAIDGSLPGQTTVRCLRNHANRRQPWPAPAPGPPNGPRGTGEPPHRDGAEGRHVTAFGSSITPGRAASRGVCVQARAQVPRLRADHRIRPGVDRGIRRPTLDGQDRFLDLGRAAFEGLPDYELKQPAVALGSRKTLRGEYPVEFGPDGSAGRWGGSRCGR